MVPDEPNAACVYLAGALGQANRKRHRLLLTNCSTQGVLFSLAFYVFLMNFLTSTPYRDLLPERSELLTHPLRSLHQFGQVYKMHAEHVSQETAEKRKRKVDDVDKRAEFRRAHGIDEENTSLLRGWLSEPHEKKTEVVEPEVQDAQSPVAKEEQFRDFEGKQQRRPVKKWLGIW